MKFYAFGFSIGLCLCGLFNDGHVSHLGLFICLVLLTIAALQAIFED